MKKLYEKESLKLPLTEKQILFLELVAAQSASSPFCGADVVRNSNNLISKGQVFAIASFLEQQMYVTSVLEEKPQFKIPRRFYLITETGRLLLDTCYKINILRQKTLRNEDALVPAGF